MDKISVVIRRDTGAIEITPELVEQALNFYFGADASVTVFYAVEQKRAPDVCRATGGDHVWVEAADYGEVCGPCGTRR